MVICLDLKSHLASYLSGTIAVNIKVVARVDRANLAAAVDEKNADSRLNLPRCNGMGIPEVLSKHNAHVECHIVVDSR